MLGSKGILTPLIPNCYVLCTLAILKTFVIRSFFFKKWLLTHVLAGPKFKNPPASKLASDFRPFDPGIISLKQRMDNLCTNTPGING